jgi:hypothetical protein
MIHAVTTKPRRVARSLHDRNPIVVWDALCDVCGPVSERWPTEVMAQAAAELHTSTADHVKASPR